MEEMDDYEQYRFIKLLKESGLWFAYENDPIPPRSSYSPQKKIYLQSAERDTFEVEETVALESKSIRDYLEESPNYRTMHFVAVPSKIMPKVIEYLKRHVDVEAKSKDPEKFDADFVKVDNATLSLLGRASKALQIKSLYKLVIQARKIPAEARTNDKMSSKEMIGN